MAERSIRFGITDGKGHRSATWKLWTPIGVKKSDVYLACRELRGELKASLHESGSWHIAYTSKMYEDKVKGTSAKHRDRFIERWPRPKPISDGITLAYRIVTPWSSTTSSIGKLKSNIICIPNAPKAKATEIDVIITAPNIPVTGWPTKRSTDTSLVGSFDLENGDTVWVVYRVVDMPDLSPATKGPSYFYKGIGPQDLESGNLRALVYGHEKDGSRVIYDCPVERRRD